MSSPKGPEHGRLSRSSTDSTSSRGRELKRAPIDTEQRKSAIYKQAFDKFDEDQRYNTII